MIAFDRCLTAFIERPTFLGEDNALLISMEEADANAIFEVADLATDRGRRVI